MLYKVTIECTVTQTMTAMVETPPSESADHEHVAEELAMDALDVGDDTDAVRITGRVNGHVGDRTVTDCERVS